MATRYYSHISGSLKLETDDSIVFDPAEWTTITAAAYNTAFIAFIQANAPQLFELQFSRSAFRTNPGSLHQSVLDTGKTYAVSITDTQNIGYTQVEFKLDGVSVNIEASAPWDYAGTAGGGEAVVTTIPAGLHTIDAVVTYPGGTFTVSADVEVN